MDFTVRTFVKAGDEYDLGNRTVRLCRDCLQDPQAGRSAAKRLEDERTKSELLGDLMSARDRGEITEEEYAERLPDLL